MINAYVFQFMACVYVYVIILTFLGPEYLGRDFRMENDEDMVAAAGEGAMDVTHDAPRNVDSSDDGMEKGQIDKSEDVRS